MSCVRNCGGGGSGGSGLHRNGVYLYCMGGFFFLGAGHEMLVIWAHCLRTSLCISVTWAFISRRRSRPSN